MSNTDRNHHQFIIILSGIKRLRFAFCWGIWPQIMEHDQAASVGHEPHIILFFMKMKSFYCPLISNGHSRLPEFLKNFFVGAQDLHEKTKLCCLLFSIRNILMD